MPFVSALLILALLIGGFLLAGIAGGGAVLLVVVPYAAFAIFLGGICWRVGCWARSPVPFRIPTTCGQQRSLPWIKSARLDNPSTGLGVVGRMLLEILLFRSLFRNNRAELSGEKYLFGDSKWLWLGALAFHWALLVIVLRHLRLVLETVPWCVLLLAKLDGFFQVGAPVLYLSNIVVLGALAYLLLRRWYDLRLRYISQAGDYFAVLLLVGICASGVLMRYGSKVDVVAVKQLMLGLATFAPLVPAGLGHVFLIHLMLVSVLVAYFPFSKLVHMGGALLSPTRNLANNSRMKRHVNPWNYAVKTHPYAEWEEEFRPKLIMAEIPLEEATHE